MSSLLTAKELRAELTRLQQARNRLVRMRLRMIDQGGWQQWERAVSVLEHFELELRLALAITEAGQNNWMKGKYHV